MAKQYKAGEFKAKCLKILDDVLRERETVYVTKRGRLVVAVIPPPRKPKRRPAASMAAWSSRTRPDLARRRALGGGPVIALDTHAWIWFAAHDPKLSRRW